MIDAFKNYWKQEVVIQDRKGLVGEFLCEAASKEVFNYITWDFEEPKGDLYKIFINVGIWENAEEFKEQVAKYFNDSNPLQEFEADRRIRTVLEPKCWRAGEASLPRYDSGGVL